MCYSAGGNISTELQSLTGLCVMTDYHIHFNIMTEENVYDKMLRNAFAVGNKAR